MTMYNFSLLECSRLLRCWLIWLLAFMFFFLFIGEGFADRKCWPLNGCIVKNNYAQAIEVCIDGVRIVKRARWTSICGGLADRCKANDIDHVKEPRSGAWYKIRNDNVIIEGDGSLKFSFGTWCRALRPCGDC